MKTGRYSAAEQRKHDEVLAQMALVIRLRPDLSYFQISKQFDCSTAMVHTVARKAGLLRPRGRRKKQQATAAVV